MNVDWPLGGPAGIAFLSITSKYLLPFPLPAFALYVFLIKPCNHDKEGEAPLPLSFMSRPLFVV